MDAIMGTPAPNARTLSKRLPPEGRLVAPPALVRQHRGEDAETQQAFWEVPSPASDPSHELETLRTAWRELSEIIANIRLPEVPETFQMPPAPTTRIRARVRHVGPAPFVFVDELAE